MVRYIVTIIVSTIDLVSSSVQEPEESWSTLTYIHTDIDTYNNNFSTKKSSEMHVT
jgi:hypothetical protein